MIQLSSKALIKPFDAGMGKADSSIEDNPSDVQSLEEFDHDDDTDDDSDAGLFDNRDKEDHGEDKGKSETLSEKEHSSLLDDTVRQQFVRLCPRYALGLFLFYLISDIGDLFLTALTTFIYNHSFNYHCPPGMAMILPGP